MKPRSIGRGPIEFWRPAETTSNIHEDILLPLASPSVHPKDAYLANSARTSKRTTLIHVV
jgi:hypothetical protein